MLFGCSAQFTKPELILSIFTAVHAICLLHSFLPSPLLQLEGMFNDLRTSEEFMRSYRSDRGAVPPGQVELDVQVLTTGYWPVLKAGSCKLPLEIQASADAFRTYYLGRHTGRKLTWQSGMGTAEVRYRSSGGSSNGGKGHELVVSTFQAVMLLQFNALPEGGGLTLAQLRASTGIINDEDEFKRHLLSLTAPKARILNRSGKARDPEDGEVFTINASYDSKLYKVKVPLISMKSIQAGGGGGGGGAGAGDSAGGGGGREGAQDVSEEVAEASFALANLFFFSQSCAE